MPGNGFPFLSTTCALKEDVYENGSIDKQPDIKRRKNGMR
jgi:hypothetical protein